MKMQLKRCCMLFQKKVEEIYRSRVFSRCDDTGRVKYFVPEDFPGLEAESYTFPTKKGDTLQGWFYSYPRADKKRLIVFAHGLGGGHRSYMREIERLCQNGYRVFSYDNTGCMMSGGAHAGGLSQSLSDLDDCLTALKRDPAVDMCDYAVMGHSWGGYATMNIAALHPDVKCLVGFAGFVSVEMMVRESFPHVLGLYRKHIMQVERESNPETVTLDATKTLANTQARVLLFHSEDDPTVSYKRHFGALKKALDGKENITLVTVKSRKHNPNYTVDAVAYKQGLYAELKKLPAEMTDDEKTAFRDAFDWVRMTEQDACVWDEVFKFLEKK